jgi:hypothetical protein
LTQAMRAAPGARDSGPIGRRQARRGAGPRRGGGAGPRRGDVTMDAPEWTVGRGRISLARVDRVGPPVGGGFPAGGRAAARPRRHP